MNRGDKDALDDFRCASDWLLGFSLHVAGGLIHLEEGAKTAARNYPQESPSS
jgi:hypothetical protein